MADIRKALAQGVDPLAEASMYANRQNETAPLGEQLKYTGQLALESLPGVGTAFTLAELEEELSKEEPDYIKVGMLVGSEAAGLIPGLGSAAKSMIRKGADMARQTDEVVDVASNIPQVSRSSIDTTKTSVEAAGLTDEAIDAWREANATSPEFRKALKGRNEELMDLAAGVKEGRVFNTTYWKRADELRPIRKVTEVPKPATVQDTVSALDKGKRKSPIVGLNYDIPDGEKITARLDIPAYVDYDVWIPTLRHSGKTMYKPALRMKNVKFIQPEGRESGMALDVAVGPQRLQDEFGLADKKAKAKGNKSPFAVMEGEYIKATDDEAYEYATSIFDSDEWTQVGYDPSKRGFFYDRETGEAILSGDEVVQVGHLVLVKNAEKVNPEVFGYNEGGVAMYNEGGAVPDNTVGVDPVSGNEVPIGSLPEEVRDDIPAQLSEGEYVVPADVVRYYGVKFFEDLRAEAKQGWAMMEANGRVGGEPVEATGMEMGQDELPFDISELQVVEMNEGGYLGGYDEGGDVNNFDTPSTSPTGNPFATSTITTKKYVDDQGNVRYVTFSGDTPLSYIPPEFKEEGTQEEAPTTEAAPVQQDDGPDIDYDRYETMRREANKFNPETAAFEDYQREMDKASGKMGSAIAGGIVSTGLGPFIGYGVSKLIDSQNRKKLEQLQKDADARAQAAKETEDLDAMNEFSGLSQEIGNILEGKETKPNSIADLLGFGKDNEIGTNSNGMFSNLLDSLKTRLTEAVSWDDEKWQKTGLADEFKYLDGRSADRSPLWGSEQESLANAIRTGNDSVVRHWEIINQHRAAADRYRQGLPTGNVMLSQRTMDRIDAERANNQSDDNDPPSFAPTPTNNNNTPSNNTNTGGYNPSTGQTATSNITPTMSFEQAMGEDEDE